MAKPQKLASNSILTVEDQIHLYEQEMGPEATVRQTYLADLQAKRCVCEPRSMKRRWDGADKATTRRVHSPTCPKFKKWMTQDVGSAGKS